MLGLMSRIERLLPKDGDEALPPLELSSFFLQMVRFPQLVRLPAQPAKLQLGDVEQRTALLNVRTEVRGSN